MLKKDIRKLMLSKLKKDNVIRSSVYNKLYSTQSWIEAKVVAVTLSTKIEINTNPVIKKGLLDGKIIVVPKIDSNRHMEFISLSKNSTFQRDIFGILEPVNGKIINSSLIDLVLVPGLAFAVLTGDRIGFGGGYYDRYLKYYNGPKISIAKSFQIFDDPTWDVNRFDIKVDRIIF